jgi:hypothetical protein
VVVRTIRKSEKQQQTKHAKVCQEAWCEKKRWGGVGQGWRWVLYMTAGAASATYIHLVHGVTSAATIHT